jgi:hypothetical protein
MMGEGSYLSSGRDQEVGDTQTRVAERSRDQVGLRGTAAHGILTVAAGAVEGARRVTTGPWKIFGVEEEHEIAASGAQPLVERPPLAGRTRWQRPAGQPARALLLAYRGGAVGGLVVHDDDLGEVRIAGEHREASGEPPFFITGQSHRADRSLGIRPRRRERRARATSSPEPAQAGAKDHHAAFARGA